MFDRIKQQEKEIATIKPRKISLNLSDADCERISELCGKHELTVSQLLENFIGDLVGGTYTNGSDEIEHARRYFERCWLGMFPEETLLKWLLDAWIDVGEFLERQDDIQSGYEDLEYAKTNPEYYDEEDIESLKTDIEDLEQELKDYKLRYLDENPKADWEKEVEKVKKWFYGKKRLVECMEENEEKPE